MKRKLCIFLCTALALGCLAGCGGSDNGKDTQATGPAGTEPGQQDETEAQAQEVTIWHDGDESIMQVIADTANKKLADDNITVRFEKKTGLTDALQLYGNDEANGPDMYLYAHDSLGALAEMGILAPVTDVVGQDVLDGMLPMTVEAGNYKNTQYLMPVYYETLLFMYNKELWEGDLPTTTDGLYEYMQSHTDAAAGTYAVVNQHSTAYNVAPFINGFGGFIIDKDGKPGLNDAKTVEAIEYNKKFAALQADGDYNTVTALFNEGKAAAIVGGPWLVSGIRDAGIDLGIASLSDFALPNGNGMAPYSGVQSIGVLKYAAENKKDALGKVLEAIAAPEVGVALANQSGCAPANAAAYDDAEVGSNEMIMAMKQTAETATPMPNIPEMSVMWGPAEEMLAAVNKSGEDVSSAADAAQEKALTAIEDMQ